MNITTTPMTYSSPDLARRIAKNYGKKPRAFTIKMKGMKDVSSLLARIAQAKSLAHSTPWQLD
jgi:hypothetical protein